MHLFNAVLVFPHNFRQIEITIGSLMVLCETWYFPSDHFNPTLQNSHLALLSFLFLYSMLFTKDIFLCLFKTLKLLFPSTGWGWCILYKCVLVIPPLTTFSHHPPFPWSSSLLPNNSPSYSHVFCCVWPTEFSHSFLYKHGGNLSMGNVSVAVSLKKVASPPSIISCQLSTRKEQVPQVLPSSMMK